MRVRPAHNGRVVAENGLSGGVTIDREQDPVAYRTSS